MTHDQRRLIKFCGPLSFLIDSPNKSRNKSNYSNKMLFWVTKTKALVGGQDLWEPGELKAHVGRCPSVTKRLKSKWAWTAFCATCDEHQCGYNGFWGKEKACVCFRDLCGVEAWKTQADKTTFVVRRTKACVSLEGLFWPDESMFLPCTGAYGTRSTEEREPLRELTLYMIFLFRTAQPRCLKLSTKHQRRRNKNVI